MDFGIILNDTSIAIDAGQWFLTFFRDFVATPAILVGLFAMLGSILLRKKTTDIISSFFKTAAGFLIISGGAGIVSGSLTNFQLLFQDLFGINGIVPNNDAFAGDIMIRLPQIAQLGSIIMVLAMILNIVLASTSRFKFVFLSGHVLFYMSIMLAAVLAIGGGFDLNDPGDYAIALISSSMLMSVYMVLSCAMTHPWTKQITGQEIAVAHTGSVCYAMGGLVGNLVHKIKKGEKIKSTESFNFPKGLQFFRNTFISMAITMLVVFLVVYLPEGIMYNTGVKQLVVGATEKNDALKAIFGPNASINWLVKCILDAFTFAAGVEVILLGVRMVVGELVPSFKGISDKLIKNSKAGIDCPIVFPYAPNAVLIGFVSSVVGAIAGLGISVGISGVSSIPIILPGIVAQFFLGATTGVFGNVKGGIWGCVIGAFLNGIIITMVPIIFYVGGWVPGEAPLAWGDTDYLLGLIPGLLAMPKGVTARVLVMLIPALIFLGLVGDGLYKKYVTDKKAKSTPTSSVENNTQEKVVTQSTAKVTVTKHARKPAQKTVTKPKPNVSSKVQASTNKMAYINQLRY